jgi:hypothetical protein
MLGIAVVHISMVYALVFLGGQLGEMNCLDLVPIGEVAVVRGFHGVVVIIRICGRQLVLGCRFEVMRSLAMVICSLMMHIVLMLCRH